MPSLKKLLVGGMFAAFLVMPFGVSAQTMTPERLASLQAQIAQLVQMVAALQAQLHMMQSNRSITDVSVENSMGKVEKIPSTLSVACTGAPYVSGTLGASWHAGVSGGSGIYGYQWTALDDAKVGGEGGLQTAGFMATYNSAGAKHATVTVTDGASKVVAQCIAQVGNHPYLQSINPASGSSHTSVLIYGNNLSSVSAVEMLSSDGQVVASFKPRSASDQKVLLNLGAVAGFANPGVYQLRTVSPNGTSNSMSFTLQAYTESAPALSSIDPSSGGAGTKVTLSGTNLSNASSVEFYRSSGQLGIEIPGSLLSISSSNVSFTISKGVVGMAGGETYQVRIVTPKGTSNAVSFSLASP